MTPPNTGRAFYTTEVRELMESKIIRLSSYVTGVLHTAEISTVEVQENSNKCHVDHFIFHI